MLQNTTMKVADLQIRIPMPTMVECVTSIESWYDSNTLNLTKCVIIERQL